MSDLKWIKIAGSAEEILLGSNQMTVLEVEGKRVCIGRSKEQWVAFAFKCPHAGGIMANGWFDGFGNVVCPLHRYRFNPVNGRNTSGEGYYLKTWPVEVREEGIFIGMKKGWF